MIMYTNTSMVHMGIITHHSPLYEGNDQVVIAIQTFIIPLHSFNTSNYNHNVNIDWKIGIIIITLGWKYMFILQLYHVN